MKLFEYMGKELFRDYGLPVPEGQVVTSPAAALSAASSLGTPVVLKAQVLAGKRGKSGLIKFPHTVQEVEEESRTLLGLSLNGAKVECLLLEEKLEIQKEFYLALTIDATAAKPVLISSACGGMDIEEVPDEQILKLHLDPTLGIQSYHTREICTRLGLEEDLAKQFAGIVSKLYQLFQDIDAELVEINPLILSNSVFVAGDAKVVVDDSALNQHKDLPYVEERTELEKLAHAAGLSYVELDGDIAIMANGAGINMGTIDMIAHYGGRASNFLDAGGGSSVEATAKALEILLAGKPKVIFINIFGGITRCDDVAAAFAQVKREKGIPVPTVIRLVGTNQAEGIRILQECGIEVYQQMAEAAQKAVELANLA